MTTGLSAARRNSAIDSTVALGTWVKLHLGDPGAAGTSSPAVNTTRRQATMGAAASGTATSTATLTWTAVSTTETYTHFSMWTASTAGTFLCSGTVTSGAVTAGQDFVVNAGGLTISVSGAA